MTNSLGVEFASPPKAEGPLLADRLKTLHLPSISMREGLSRLPQINSVVVVGALKAGKRTFLDTLDAASRTDPKLKSQIIVPQRWNTRQDFDRVNMRLDRSVDPVVFAGIGREDGSGFGLRWTRKQLSDTARTVEYAYEPLTTRESGKSLLPIYLGSSSMFTNPNSVQPPGFLHTALVVFVDAPEDVRGQRFQALHPEFRGDRPRDLEHRFQTPPPEVKNAADIVVNNSGDLEPYAPSDVVKVVRAVVDIKQAV